MTVFFKLENEKLIFSLVAVNVIIYFNILKYLVECISLFVNLYLITLPKFFYKINKIIFSFNYVFPVFCGIFILVLYLFPEYFQFLKFSLYSVTHMKTGECISNFLEFFQKSPHYQSPVRTFTIENEQHTNVQQNAIVKVYSNETLVSKSYSLDALKISKISYDSRFFNIDIEYSKLQHFNINDSKWSVVSNLTYKQKFEYLNHFDIAKSGFFHTQPHFGTDPLDDHVQHSQVLYGFKFNSSLAEFIVGVDLGTRNGEPMQEAVKTWLGIEYPDPSIENFHDDLSKQVAKNIPNLFIPSKFPFTNRKN